MHLFTLLWLWHLKGVVVGVTVVTSGKNPVSGIFNNTFWWQQPSHSSNNLNIYLHNSSEQDHRSSWNLFGRQNLSNDCFGKVLNFFLFLHKLNVTSSLGLQNLNSQYVFHNYEIQFDAILWQDNSLSLLTLFEACALD